MKNKYYVYEWIRLDTNEPFYVGKGCGSRWRKLTRDNNSYFNNIVKSISVAVNILHDNLDEETAFGLEVWYIREYRDIIGYNLVNIDDGGTGCALCGENNPFYGKYHTEETKYKISKSRKGKYCGEENHNYGKNFSEETKKKMSDNHADFSNKKHPRATKIICITTGKIFNTIKEGAEYYNIKNKGNIVQCCKGKYKSAGKLEDGTKLIWMYYKDYLKEKVNEI